jgi:transcription antitermination factor NusG
MEPGRKSRQLVKEIHWTEPLEWYVIQSKRFREHFAARHLAALGVTTYVPMVNEIGASSGTRHPAPLFSGYIFIQTQLSKVAALERVPGVKGVVRLGGAPATLNHTVIEALKRQENKEGVIELHRTPVPRRAYEIAVGPLQGTRAIVTGGTLRSGRVRVLMSLLGREVGVDVAVEWLHEL